MHRRSLLIAATTAALAIGALAVPVAAVNPSVTFVNGIPGKTVEVCVGNQEVKSGLKYGKWVVRSVADGSRTIRFRQNGPGTCNGNVLAQRTFNFLEDGNYTVVGTKNTPDRVVIYDNNDTPIPNVLCGCWVAHIRHAADVGPVVIHEETTTGVTPSALPPTFSKGDERRQQGTVDYSAWVMATKLSSVDPLAGPKHFAIFEGRRGEIILIGTSKKNAKFVGFSRSLPFPIIILP